MTGSVSVSALVLRKADWRDYDRMVTLLTAEKGRVDAVVRGCRRPKSELVNAAEPFVCGSFQLYYAKDRYTVTQCRVTDGFYPIREDYDRLTLGAKWLKLLEETGVEDEPAEDLFRMALSALSYLAYSDIELGLLDAMFLMKLCFLNGFAPAADKCAVCGKSARDTVLGFDAAKGGCVCRQCAPNARPLSEGARRILLKAPRTPYKAVEKLVGHPDWPEAGERIREFVQNVIGKK